MSRRWITAVATTLLLVSSSAAPALALGAEETVPVVKPSTQTPLQQLPDADSEPAAGATAADETTEGATGADEPLADDADTGETMTDDAEAPLFADLPPEHWAYPEVARLVEAGVIHGDPQGQFRPDAPVSRAEFLKMLLTARRLDPAGHCAGIFRDAQCWTWYAPYVELAYRLAILEPVTDTTDLDPDEYFDPEGAITRQEVASALIRVTGKRWTAEQRPWDEVTSTLRQFSDHGQIAYAHRKAMALAIDLGLVRGFGDGTLRPGSQVTRAEAAVLVGRVLLDTAGLPTAYMDGREIVYVEARPMRATKYTVGEPGVGWTTRTGVTVRHGAVAVDPDEIALGTLLYVEGYGYAVALDTGGAVKGDKIDLFDWVSPSRANTFGIQPRTVWILP